MVESCYRVFSNRDRNFIGVCSLGHFNLAKYLYKKNKPKIEGFVSSIFYAAALEHKPAMMLWLLEMQTLCEIIEVTKCSDRMEYFWRNREAIIKKIKRQTDVEKN